MVYRIRYHQDASGSGGEVTLEANSPSEAMVKFQYTSQGRSDGRHRSGVRVTSVQAEPVLFEETM
jgi:hypothetical protein